jgi:uncharacterized protein YgbK (DUF1537 family)
MKRLLVIADDLSGATDVGAQFAENGVEALILVEPAKMPDSDFGFAALFEKNAVVIVNTESRHLPASQAFQRVAEVVRETRLSGIEFFYKKTDSTLRGNIGAELEALLKESGQPRLCFIPAHPRLGRITRDGVCYVHGQLLHQSGFSTDPRNPVNESSIRTILSRQTSVPLTLVRRSALSTFESHSTSGIVLFDIETFDDLDTTWKILERQEGFQAMAGSAAFAGCLARRMGKQLHRNAPAKNPEIHLPLLVVNGSLNEVALRQCEQARRNHFSDIRIPPEVALMDDGSDAHAENLIIERTRSLLESGRNVILSTAHRREDCGIFESLGTELHLKIYQQHELVARNIGRLIAQIAGSFKPGTQIPTLVIFGGDTLLGIARAMNWRAFIPQQEILPGVAVFKTIEPPHSVVMSKPGGFGPDDVLDQLLRSLNPEKLQSRSGQ